MEIKTNYISRIDKTRVEALYRDVDDYEELDGMKIESVHAVCFCGGKMVLVYEKDKKTWSSPGGGVEDGESVEQAVVREVREESNMKVIQQKLIGVQINILENGRKIIQTRSVCLVEPYGDFVSDPAGDVTEIKLIDPAEYAKYYYWGANSDRMMERALDKAKEMQEMFIPK
ncbi:MAG: NUDIX hydrolase [bacterium]